MNYLTFISGNKVSVTHQERLELVLLSMNKMERKLPLYVMPKLTASRDYKNKKITNDYINYIKIKANLKI